MTVGSVGEASYGIGPRFVTAEHWRLHQLFPEEMAHATQHFTDMVERQLELAVEEGLAARRRSPRDAWFITKLVMATFHHYAYAEAPTDTQRDRRGAVAVLPAGDRRTADLTESAVPRRYNVKHVHIRGETEMR